MNRNSVLLLSVLLPLTSAAQGVLLDEIEDPVPPEMEMPELRQYSVEVIVFAYAEDVHVGTEIFVPELLPEPELLYDENGFPILESIDGGFVDGEMVDAVFVDGQWLDPETGLPVGQEPAEESVEEQEETPDTLMADESATDEPEVLEPVTFTFELMMEEDYTLLDTLSRLDELDAYEPLMHFGWIQGMLPDAETEVLTLETFDVPPYGLEGELTLYLSRYLHLVVDLELAADRVPPPGYGDEFEDGFGDSYGDDSAREAEDPYRRGRASREEPEPVPIFTDNRIQGSWGRFPEPAEPRYAPLRYQISEDRIVRNGELRYYDHPKFGVIARVVRVEEEEEPEQPDDGEDGALPASVLAQ
ncbi:MAG: CsiV family protein [Woeseiaceae bacterium]|nr:CsiV family protein [Woeseiaceae bacterium]